MTCKNEIPAGQPRPRTCSECGLGPCKKSSNNEKYAALIKTDIYHDGDERSRTNPGHGYSAYIETIDRIIKFENINKMKEWVALRGHYDKYTIIKYVELSVETEIVVKVK